MAGNDAIASHYERWTIPPHARLMKVYKVHFQIFIMANISFIRATVCNLNTIVRKNKIYDR